jgi:hypothetical protein
MLGSGFALGAAWAAPRGSSGRVRAVAVMLGDSNETLPATEVADQLLNRDNGYALVNIARPGATIRAPDCAGTDQTCATYDFWQHRVADARARIDPDAWVVDLGINDTVRAGSANGPGYSNYAAKIDWLLAQLGKARVLWTNLPCKIEPASRARGCAAVDAALARAPSRHANLTVVDWAGVANEHREYLGPDNTFGAVHLTLAGRSAWARLIATRLDAQFSMPAA